MVTAPFGIIWSSLILKRRIYRSAYNYHDYTIVWHLTGAGLTATIGLFSIGNDEQIILITGRLAERMQMNGEDYYIVW